MKKPPKESLFPTGAEILLGQMQARIDALEARIALLETAAAGKKKPEPKKAAAAPPEDEAALYALYDELVLAQAEQPESLAEKLQSLGRNRLTVLHSHLGLGAGHRMPADKLANSLKKKIQESAMIVYPLRHKK